MKIQLTELQSNIITPLVQEKNQADKNLQEAVALIVGKKFTKYTISKGILEIDIEEDKPLEELK